MNKPTFKDIYYLCIQKLTNFPYIEQDFDALTNYELLCKVVEYLKKVMDNEQIQNETIIALSAAFTDLKEYVDNYFENLDVQDEINNKLDDMAEQGILQEMIAEYLNSRAVFGFDTVADMKQATNLINGSYAKTLGYHSRNDEGSALYKIRTITNDDVVDEMLIIELADDNLVAEYINENGVISPEQMGAYGDNIHDDSTILNAILQIANSKKYEIKGNKTYKTTVPLVITYNDMNITLNTINYTGVENAVYLKGKRNKVNIGTINSNGVGFYITCSNTETTVNNEINIDYINSEKHAIYMFTDSWGIYENYFKFMHFVINDNTCNGIHMISALSSTHTTSYINQNIFYGGRIDGANYALYADASNGQINEIVSYNISAESSNNAIYLNKVTDSSFENWRIEELTNTSGHLYMKMVGNSGNNNFRFNRYVPLEMIDRTELTNGSAAPNIIHSNIRDTRQGGYLGSIMKFYGSGQLDFSMPRLRSKTITGDTTLSSLDFVKFFNVSATATTPTIILNDMYGDYGINTFYVYKRVDTTSITIKLADESNSLEITRNGLNQVMIIGGLILVQ